MNKKEVNKIVNESLIDVLDLEEDEIYENATLLGDLGAESLDLLDVLFRIERKTGTKVSMQDIQDMIQGAIPEEELETEDGYISEKGLQQLKKNLPQIDIDELRGTFEAEQVLALFTVENLISLVYERVSKIAEVEL